MGKRLGRRKNHGRRKRPRRNRCGLGWCRITKESISCGVGLTRKPRMAFLDSKQRLGDGGLYRLDRNGLQYVRSTEERTGLVLAWSAF